MSSSSIHNVICPYCKKEQSIERYNSINDYHKELFPKIVNKSIFDYICSSCGEKVHDPYPLLFHKMGLQDIQIGYKLSPIGIPIVFNPFMELLKKSINDKGIDTEDICEFYTDEDEFTNRVKSFITNADLFHLWCEGLSNEEWEEKHNDDEKIIYLHGKCDEWVLENYQNGDIAVIWNNFHEELEKVTLVHCYIIRNEKYVDVRGETPNIEDIEDGFDYYDDNNKYHCKTLDEYKKMIRTICGYTDEKWQ